MLVKCATCGVSFDPALRRCVFCGEDYVFTTNEESTLFEGPAWVRLESGARGSEVRRWLVDEQRVDPQTAEAIVRKARERIKRQPRHLGLILMAIGAFLAVGAYNQSVWFGDWVATFDLLGQMAGLASVLLIAGGLVKYVWDGIRMRRALWRCDH